MSHLSIIQGFFSGDSLQIERDVTGVITTDALIKAWFTVKTVPTIADPGSLQKIITTAAVPDVGQITEDGSELQGNGTATVVFQLTAAETATLGYTTQYVWDIQVKTASGKVYTPHKGTIRLLQGVTDATS